MMNDEQTRDGLHGWTKWVVVIAALITIVNTVYEGVRGMVDSYKAHSQETAPTK